HDPHGPHGPGCMIARSPIQPYRELHGYAILWGLTATSTRRRQKIAQIGLSGTGKLWKQHGGIGLHDTVDAGPQARRAPRPANEHSPPAYPEPFPTRPNPKPAGSSRRCDRAARTAWCADRTASAT